MDRDATIRLMGTLRILVGVIVWLAPRPAGRLFGLDVEGDRQLRYVSRLFAVRDGVLGWGALTSRGEAQQRWVIGGLACDALDAAASIAATRSREISPLAGVMFTGAALSGVALGLRTLAAGR